MRKIKNIVSHSVKFERVLGAIFVGANNTTIRAVLCGHVIRRSQTLFTATAFIKKNLLSFYGTLAKYDKI